MGVPRYDQKMFGFSFPTPTPKQGCRLTETPASYPDAQGDQSKGRRALASARGPFALPVSHGLCPHFGRGSFSESRIGGSQNIFWISQPPEGMGPLRSRKTYITFCVATLWFYPAFPFEFAAEVVWKTDWQHACVRGIRSWQS